MNATEIRQSFLSFFRERGHVIVPSAPVVPLDDPTLMFTNAGMNQFKPYFLGQATPAHRRVADTQKCIRVSGKHNDLEEVGHDTYHHTLFEMLGNWSFGDYYKREAIEWAWDLLTRVWGLPKERLYATVFGGDEERGLPADHEAERLWAEVTDIDPTHIQRFGAKDNFWMMGDVGPCGPCSEIHIDLTPDGSGASLVNAGSPQVMELWNLVFIEFNAEADGGLKKLPSCHVDTGAGLDRISAVMECTGGGRDFSRQVSNYDTALFRPIIERLVEISGRTYTPGVSNDEDSIAMRVCADHLRMVAFSIADGAIPSNESRGYVVRRVLRRAARYGRKLGLMDPFLYTLVPVLAETMGDVFPELRREQSKIEQVMRGEETSFHQTLDRGIALFEDEAAGLEAGGVFPGETAFKLYDTFGFPLDLTEVMARERGLTVDEAGFQARMEEQRARARASQVKVAQLAEDEEICLEPTPFTGYVHLEEETTVVATLGKGDQRAVVLEETPFYAEMGGQVGDTGILLTADGEIRVTDTRTREHVILHHLAPESGRILEPGEKVVARVDRERRLQTQRHHTATHLLHHALREVLGDNVRQQGSLVTPDRLRFDFACPEAVAPEKLRAIERHINRRILENSNVGWIEIPLDLKPPEVIAFFGDKYGDRVRVLNIGGRYSGQMPEPLFDGYSKELCGGTHTLRTGDIGLFRFLSEGAIASGVRRVEAVVGSAAEESVHRDLELLERASARLHTTPAELERRLEALLEGQKKLERELAEARKASARSRVADLAASALQVDGVPLLATDVGDGDADYLLQLADGLREKFQGVAVLAGVTGERVGLLALVTPAYVKAGYHAGNLIRQVARELGGGGGGRPDLAQAGAKDASRLPQVLAAVPEMLKATARK